MVYSKFESVEGDLWAEGALEIESVVSRSVWTCFSLLHPVGCVAVAYMTSIFICTEADAVDATTLCSDTYQRYQTNTETNTRTTMDWNRGTMRNTVGKRDILRYRDGDRGATTRNSWKEYTVLCSDTALVH